MRRARVNYLRVFEETNETDMRSRVYYFTHYKRNHVRPWCIDQLIVEGWPIEWWSPIWRALIHWLQYLRFLECCSDKGAPHSLRNRAGWSSVWPPSCVACSPHSPPGYSYPRLFITGSTSQLALTMCLLHLLFFTITIYLKWRNIALLYDQ